MHFAIAMGAVERTVALRAFAAQLGYFARRSKRLLSSELDSVRFMSPVVDVLADLGDELRHLHHVHGLTVAPRQVLTSIQLLGAISKRAVHDGSLQTSASACVQSRAPIVVSLFDSLGGDQVFHPVHPPGKLFGRVSTDVATAAVDLIGSWVPAPPLQQRIVTFPVSFEHSHHDVVEITEAPVVSPLTSCVVGATGSVLGTVHHASSTSSVNSGGAHSSLPFLRCFTFQDAGRISCVSAKHLSIVTPCLAHALEPDNPDFSSFSSLHREAFASASRAGIAPLPHPLQGLRVSRSSPSFCDIVKPDADEAPFRCANASGDSQCKQQ